MAGAGSTLARSAIYPRWHGFIGQGQCVNDWSAWKNLLGSQARMPGAGPEQAMSVRTTKGFNTVSSSLIAIPAARQQQPVWQFAPRYPKSLDYQAISLE